MAQSALFFQIFSVTMPVFSLVIIGMFLKRVGMMPDTFVDGASNLVYRVTLPIFLFLALSKSDLRIQFDSLLVNYYIVANFLMIGLCWLVAKWWIRPEQRAVFIQGAFRGNQGIISLALAISLYGDDGLQLAGLMAGLAAILNNVFAVVIFSVFGESYKAKPLTVLRDIARNPLIIGVVAGSLVSLLGLSFPNWVVDSGTFLGSLTLPLALLCIGATLSFNTFKESGRAAIQATLMKLIWIPLIFTSLGWFIGIKGVSFGILFVFVATPTASASYIMARVSGSDEKLAANIVAMTTFTSIFTIIAGLYLLQTWGLMP